MVGWSFWGDGWVGKKVVWVWVMGFLVRWFIYNGVWVILWVWFNWELVYMGIGGLGSWCLFGWGKGMELYLYFFLCFWRCLMIFLLFFFWLGLEGMSVCGCVFGVGLVLGLWWYCVESWFVFMVVVGWCFYMFIKDNGLFIGLW